MYDIDGKEVIRVTEVPSGLECEAVARNIKEGVKKDLVANAITMPGTLTHWKIEDFLHRKEGLGPAEPLEWSGAQKQILEDWTENGSVMERLIMPAEDGFQGFLQFYNKYYKINEDGEKEPGIDPVFIEKTMAVEDFKGTGHAVGGTVDLIARVWLKGYLDDDGLFHECKHKKPHDPTCECEKMWVVTIIDWKLSKRKQPSHPEQLSAYRYMAKETGVMDIATDGGKYPINYHNWSILLKMSNPGEVGYHHHKYEYDLDSYLRGLKVFDDPDFVSYDHRYHHYGLKGRCMFCAYQNNCPDRRTHTTNTTVKKDINEVAHNFSNTGEQDEN